LGGPLEERLQEGIDQAGTVLRIAKGPGPLGERENPSERGEILLTTFHEPPHGCEKSNIGFARKATFGELSGQPSVG
jgi:hypothetical protein